MADGYIRIDTKILDKNFDKDIARIKTGLLALSGAMSAFGVKSISVGKSFEKSMSQVGATMGLTVEEIRSGTGAFAELEKAARDAGANTEWSASEAADALNYMALAGYNAEQSINTLPTVLNLATAGGLELATASDMITDAMSALGLSLENVGDFSDVLVKTSQKSNTNVRQLGEAILTVGGTARILKGGVAELSSALGVLATNGIKGAEGGTALRNVINQLSAPTSQAQKEIDRLGISIFDIQGNMRSLQDIFADFNSVLGNLTEQERQQALSNIFNVRDLKSVRALMKATNGELSSLEQELLKAKGATDQTAKVMQDNLAGSLKSLKSKFEDLSITIYKQNVPALRQAVDEFGKFIQGFSKGDDVKKFAKAIGDMVVALTQLVKSAIPIAIKVFNALGATIKFVADNFGILSTAFISYKAGTIAVALATKVATASMTGCWAAFQTFFLSTVVGAIIAGIFYLSKKIVEFKESYNKAFEEFNKEPKTPQEKQLRRLSAEYVALKNEIQTLEGPFSKITSKIFGGNEKIDEKKKRLAELKDQIDKLKESLKSTDETKTDKVQEQLDNLVKGMNEFKKGEQGGDETLKTPFDALMEDLKTADKNLSEFKLKWSAENNQAFNPLSLNDEDLETYKKLKEIFTELEFKSEQIKNTEEKTLNLWEGVSFNRQELTDALSQLSTGFEELGESIVKGGASFNTLAKAGLNAIGSLVDALAKQAEGEAITALLAGNYSLFSMGLAKAAAIRMAAGVIKANAGKFADGGIVGGSSYSGDRLTANVNSGELILNMAQQENLANMLLSKANSQPVVNVQVINNTNSRVGVEQDEMNNIKIMIDSEINSYMSGPKGEKLLSSNYGVRKVGVR